ncbi:DUF1661 domain-containing protein [Porphyromonas gingivalis]|uniref:DUF1661 domain-containing protein n=1 Tax=Porphyromonas gingivalis TaxID=837 RepID=UPI000F622C42|nr:DUF1661 domain-containing protein [Porphyromonas gingivalis]RRG13543.1 DUF1661 domain-containing protein [Porphyromonas gingivalis]
MKEWRVIFYVLVREVKFLRAKAKKFSRRIIGKTKRDKNQNETGYFDGFSNQNETG